MKKIFGITVLILSVFTLFLPCFLGLSPILAMAEQIGWARVIRENTYLFADVECSKQVFELEKSYYVKILETNDNTHFVEVMQNNQGFPPICGYVKKNEVRLCDDEPTSPVYPNVTLTVNGNSAILKLSPTPSAEVVVVATNTQKVSYYGKIYSYDQTWYYVYFAGKFGYVLAENLTLPTVTLHPTPIDTPTDVPVVAPPTDTDNDVAIISPTAEVILIVFVSLVALAITFALFLPAKGKMQTFDGDI